MALRDEIQGIRDRTIDSLNDAHDYFEYTKYAWRSIQQDVQRGGRQLRWENLSTRSALTEKDVALRAQRYVKVELAVSTLQQFVSIFEGFLFEAIRAWTLAYPERISKRQLSGKDILAMPDKQAIIDVLVEKELKEIFYDRPANWFDYLKQTVHITAPSDAEAEKFAEIKATRDVLVHGQGVANAYYVDKAGKLARVQPGKLLEVTGPYHQSAWDLICKLVRDIGTEMASKA
jgi:hypothetical protein